MTEKRMQKVYRGKVVSTGMDKSIVVRIDELKTHSKYNKQYRSSQKFLVHDEENTAAVGDIVEFVQTKPMSKNKSFILHK